MEGIGTNGEHFFINAKGQAARDASGNIVSVFGTIHDITEQRKLGEIAQKSAVLEERARIAGEIHDSLAQSFAAIVLQTEIAEERLSGNNSDELKGNIAKARNLLASAWLRHGDQPSRCAPLMPFNGAWSVP